MIQKFWQKRVFEKEIFKKVSTKQLDNEFKIKKIAVIIDPLLEVDADFFFSLSECFKILEPQIKILYLSDNPNLKEYSHMIFNPKEVSYWGNFKGNLLEFCEREYDLVINYFNTSELIHLLISLRTKGKFSVGFSGTDLRINDLVFDFNPKDKNTFKEELIKYMSILNKI